MSKRVTSSVVELLSVAAITVGTGMVSVAAGLIVGGGFGLLFARNAVRR